MAKSFRPASRPAFTRAKPAKSLFAPTRAFAPPSERVVAAVLQYADLRQEHDDGRVTLRFSPARLALEDMALLLGEERARAADVSVIWDETECELVRVIDVGPLRAAREDIDQINRYAAIRKRSVRTPIDGLDHAAAA